MPEITLHVGQYLPLNRTLDWPCVPRPGERFALGKDGEFIVDFVFHSYSDPSCRDGVHVYLCPFDEDGKADPDEEVCNSSRADLVRLGFSPQYPEAGYLVPEQDPAHARAR